jgi:hypothetical protein
MCSNIDESYFENHNRNTTYLQILLPLRLDSTTSLKPINHPIS